MKTRPEIKKQARENFLSQYGICVGAIVLFMLIVYTASIIYDIFYIRGLLIYGSFSRYIDYFEPMATISQISFLLSVFLYPPVIVGYYSFSLRIYRGETGDISDMFRTGFSNYWRKVGGMLWMYLFTWLWSLLFIIPGIVKGIAYFMTPYILSDCPNVTATDALKLSMRMTDGYKGEIFIMALSFLGWGILTSLTFGLLGILYTGPYTNVSFAGLYDELKRNALERGVVSEAELA